jgi:hypothetical protein
LDIILGSRLSACFLKGLRMSLNVCPDNHRYPCSRQVGYEDGRSKNSYKVLSVV